MKTLIEKSKYLSLIAVISLLITFVLSLFWGISRAVNTWTKIILSIGQAPGITISILKLIDVFLIAIFLYILAVSIYKLFVSDVELPTSLVARNLAELKGKLHPPPGKLDPFRRMADRHAPACRARPGRGVGY